MLHWGGLLAGLRALAMRPTARSPDRIPQALIAIGLHSEVSVENKSRADFAFECRSFCSIFALRLRGIQPRSKALIRKAIGDALPSSIHLSLPQLRPATPPHYAHENSMNFHLLFCQLLLSPSACCNYISYAQNKDSMGLQLLTDNLVDPESATRRAWSCCDKPHLEKQSDIVCTCIKDCTVQPPFPMLDLVDACLEVAQVLLEAWLLLRKSQFNIDILMGHYRSYQWWLWPRNWRIEKTWQTSW